MKLPTVLFNSVKEVFPENSPPPPSFHEAPRGWRDDVIGYFRPIYGRDGVIAKKIGRDAVIEEERCDAICNTFSPHRGGEMTLSTIFCPFSGARA